MRILVTRPAEDAAAIAAILTARGHRPVVAPLLSVHFHDGPEVSFDNVQAILATSANGVRALARRTPRRDVPLFTVGPQTAQAAHDAGFQTVKNAGGDARALAAATARWATPEGGALLHAKGAEGEGTLSAALTECGFDLRSVVLYDVSLGHLPPDFGNVLAALDAALFFSPRSARVFKDLALSDGLNVSSLIAICISEATAAALSPLTFREIRIATEPNQDALLAYL